MSILTGPTANIYADTTIPGTTAVAMTGDRISWVGDESGIESWILPECAHF